MTVLRVYVPSVDNDVAERIVLPGSGIVGSELGDGNVLIDYEGNKYGGEYFQRYGRRVFHAAGRHVEKYPTVARAVVPADSLLPVGWFDTETRELTVDDSEKLAGWIGEYDDSELVS